MAKKKKRGGSKDSGGGSKGGGSSGGGGGGGNTKPTTEPTTSKPTTPTDDDKSTDSSDSKRPDESEQSTPTDSDDSGTEYADGSLDVPGDDAEAAKREEPSTDKKNDEASLVEDTTTDPTTRATTTPSRRDLAVDGPAGAPDAQVDEFADQGVASAVAQTSAQAEQQAAKRLNAQAGTDEFGTDDVATETSRNEDGELVVGVGLSESGQQTATTVAEQQAFEQLQAQTDADLDRDDVRVDTSGGGEVAAELTESGRRAEAAADSDRFDEDDLLVTSAGDVAVSNQAQREAIAAETEGVNADDVVLQDSRGDDGEVETEASLTDEGRIELAAARTEGVNADDLEIRDGEVVVTEDNVSQLDRSVSRFENLTGTDIPGEGQAIPEVDPQATIENATGIDLPELLDDQPLEQVTETTVSSAVEALDEQAQRTDNEFGTAEQQAGIDQSDDGPTVADLADRVEGARGPAELEEDIFVNLGTEGRQIIYDESEAAARAEAQARVDETEEINENIDTGLGFAAVGRSPGSAVNAGRAVAGIAGLASGAVIVDEATNNDDSELQVPEEAGQSELDAGELNQDVSELEASEQVEAEVEPGTPVDEVVEVGVPDDASNAAINLSPAVIGQEQAEETEDQREIPLEDIIDDRATIEEPDQAPPSTRERQRRDDLEPYERTFPTGSSAVVGEGTVEEQTERVEDAQNSRVEETTELGVGSGQQPGVVTGVGNRQEQRQTPLERLDGGVDAGQRVGVDTSTDLVQTPTVSQTPAVTQADVFDTALDLSTPNANMNVDAETDMPEFTAESAFSGFPAQRSRRPRFDFGFEDDESTGNSLSYELSESVFDTGVVDTLDELDDLE